jgi:serine/threonine protein kinase
MWFDGNLVLIDLAMSLQVPHEPERRSLLLPQGRYGKPPYMSPEVYASRGPFDGYALDVWSSACILYNMLTNGFWLFRCPYPTDTLFRYFIMAKGLSNDPLNARTIEILMDVFQRGNDVTDRQDLLSRAMAHVQFTPTCTKLLSRMFQLRPEDRYSLAECIESSWAKGEENLRGNSLRSRDQ